MGNVRLTLHGITLWLDVTSFCPAPLNEDSLLLQKVVLARRYRFFAVTWYDFLPSEHARQQR